MTAIVVAFPKIAMRNQAIADLYKAQHEFVRAGLQGEFVHGVADDGAPWLVVCDAHGEALIHVAIVDGVIVADSPTLTKPLRGREVSEVLKRLFGRLSASELGNGPVVAILAALALHEVSELADGHRSEMRVMSGQLLTRWHHSLLSSSWRRRTGR
jgi:hypothetical protein